MGAGIRRSTPGLDGLTPERCPPPSNSSYIYMQPSICICPSTQTYNTVAFKNIQHCCHLVVLARQLLTLSTCPRTSISCVLWRRDFSLFNFALFYLVLVVEKKVSQVQADRKEPKSWDKVRTDGGCGEVHLWNFWWECCSSSCVLTLMMLLWFFYLLCLCSGFQEMSLLSSSSYPQCKYSM